MIAALFSVLLFAADTSATNTTTQPEQVPAAGEAPKEEKKICRREMATESRMASKRVCLTAAQWKARDTGVIEYRRR